MVRSFGTIKFCNKISIEIGNDNLRYIKSSLSWANKWDWVYEQGITCVRYSQEFVSYEGVYDKIQSNKTQITDEKMRNILKYKKYV